MFYEHVYLAFATHFGDSNVLSFREKLEVRGFLVENRFQAERLESFSEVDMTLGFKLRNSDLAAGRFSWVLISPRRAHGGIRKEWEDKGT